MDGQSERRIVKTFSVSSITIDILNELSVKKGIPTGRLIDLAVEKYKESVSQ